jgi:hypothetical protein
MGVRSLMGGKTIKNHKKKYKDSQIEQNNTCRIISESSTSSTPQQMPELGSHKQAQTGNTMWEA